MTYAETFFAECDEAFKHLRKQFRLLKVKRSAKRDVFKYFCANQTSGVVVIYEFTRHYIGVQVCRLINGEFPASPGEVGHDTVLNCYDVGDVLSIRSPDEWKEFRFQTTSFGLVKPELIKYASCLERHCEDILNGDFLLFQQLDAIVKDRAREAAFQKWGKRAHEFGW